MRAFAALFTLAVASVKAQTSGPNTNYTSELDIQIDPNSVDLGTRTSWCQAQVNTCGNLCDTSINTCDENTCKFNCTCASNNSAPGIEYYQGTMPFFICQSAYAQCISSTAADAKQQDQCKSIQNLCAKNTPPASLISESTSTTTSSQPSQTSTQVSTSKSKGIAAPTLVPASNGVLAAAVGLAAYMI